MVQIILKEFNLDSQKRCKCLLMGDLSAIITFYRFASFTASSACAYSCWFWKFVQPYIICMEFRNRHLQAVWNTFIVIMYRLDIFPSKPRVLALFVSMTNENWKFWNNSFLQFPIQIKQYTLVQLVIERKIRTWSCPNWWILILNCD